MTWVPPLVANAFQLVLLAMNLYFDLVERRSAAEAAQGGATEGGTSRDTRGARKAAAGFGACGAFSTTRARLRHPSGVSASSEKVSAAAGHY